MNAISYELLIISVNQTAKLCPRLDCSSLFGGLTIGSAPRSSFKLNVVVYYLWSKCWSFELYFVALLFIFWGLKLDVYFVHLCAHFALSLRGAAPSRIVALLSYLSFLPSVAPPVLLHTSIHHPPLPPLPSPWIPLRSFGSKVATKSAATSWSKSGYRKPKTHLQLSFLLDSCAERRATPIWYRLKVSVTQTSQDCQTQFSLLMFQSLIPYLNLNFCLL